MHQSGKIPSKFATRLYLNYNGSAPVVSHPGGKAGCAEAEFVKLLLVGSHPKKISKRRKKQELHGGRIRTLLLELKCYKAIVILRTNLYVCLINMDRAPPVTGTPPTVVSMGSTSSAQTKLNPNKEEAKCGQCGAQRIRQVRAALELYHKKITAIDDDIKQRLKGGTLRRLLTATCAHFEALYEASLADALASLDERLEPFNQHLATLREALNEILNSHGLGEDYKRGAAVEKTVEEAIGHLQDIMCEAMADPVDFLDRYREGLLEFQIHLPA
ncbi:hypothetical protein FA13DRAFT_1715048 [Coprinellus micaceus]|uniref:Uncharacterized protein n=1 Tax=Coprinellus micaceus TaxID=71717 RepID=A0A4Y7SQ65_COPMI|nr:hypothetical protein FA13DRAFT_1715048 [Coprinellus micaceus]